MPVLLLNHHNHAFEKSCLYALRIQSLERRRIQVRETQSTYFDIANIVVA